MKKKIISIFLIIMALVMVMQGTVSAANYSNSYYSFYIPNTFKKTYERVTSSSSGIGYSGKYGTYSTLIEFKASTKDSGLTQYTQSDVNTRINSIKSTYTSSTSGKLTSINGYLTELNGVKGYRVTYYVKYSSGNTEYGKDIYELVSDKYKYTILIDGVKSYINSSEEKQILNSFKIKDTVLKSKGIPYADVASNAWYFNAVKYAYNNKIISGYNSYTFAPEDKVTRGMFVTMLYNMSGKPALKSNTSKFSDVKNTRDWYYKAVLWASQNNIVSGYSNGKFGPNDNITREQLAVILNQYAKYRGKNYTKTGNISGYSDYKKVSSWATTQVKWAVGTRVMTGNSNGTLNPGGTATRAETASMIYKYCTNVGK